MREQMVPEGLTEEERLSENGIESEEREQA